jgi:hypothetical protein
VLIFSNLRLGDAGVHPAKANPATLTMADAATIVAFLCCRCLCLSSTIYTISQYYCWW